MLWRWDTASLPVGSVALERPIRMINVRWEYERICNKEYFGKEVRILGNKVLLQ